MAATGVSKEEAGFVLLEAVRIGVGLRVVVERDGRRREYPTRPV